MVAATAPPYVAAREALTALTPQNLTAVRFLAGTVVIGLGLLTGAIPIVGVLTAEIPWAALVSRC